MNASIHYVPHPSCQIPNLAAIMAAKFGLRAEGTFVEVGAFDGQTVSNTSFLADLGWRGLYIEPVPPIAALCAARHQQNPRVQVVQVAVGETEQTIELHLGGVLTTADLRMLEAFGQIDWAKTFHKGQKLRVPQRPLAKVLEEAQVPQRFDLLVVDVEGGEQGVFNSFSLVEWRPRMMIVEIEDGHPSFQQFPEIVARSKALRERLQAAGYSEIFRDQINTIFWDDRGDA